MRLVHIRDGALEVRWTWLPYWIAVHPKLKSDLEDELRDAALLSGATTAEADLDAMHVFVRDRLVRMFPIFPGLSTFLDGLLLIEEPT